MDAQEMKLKEVVEFWLISAPGEKTCQQTWDVLNNVTAKQNNLSTNFKFHIPELKVGTLDVLVGLSDELGKLDAYAESVVKKMARYMGDILEEKDKWKENLSVNGTTMTSYLTKFQWDMAKFPTKQPLKNITDQITKQLTQIDADLKTRSSSYNSLKGSLQTLEKKATGSLLTRSLAEIVSKDDFILDSEYLVTLLVVVRKPTTNDWISRYETLTDMIVPRSSRKIAEDAENCLFSVTLFRKVVDEFKIECVKNKFTVREFVYNEEELLAEKNEVSKLNTDMRKQFGPLVRWLRVNFGEAFLCWMHVKALRVFVESVLRYGLPVNFQAMLLAPPKKSQKKLREVLHQLYSHLDNSGTGGPGSDVVDIPGLNLGSTDYYPYVFYKISIDVCEQQKF